MEVQKITRKEPIKTLKISGYKEKTYFVTSDGREFTKQKEAEEYQKAVDNYNKIKYIRENIKQFNIRIMGESYTWFYASNDDELEYIKNNVYFYNKRTNIFINDQPVKESIKDLCIGQWITGSYTQDDRYVEDSVFYTLSYLEKKVIEALQKTKELL
jgi:hypothetical protein